MRAGIQTRKSIVTGGEHQITIDIPEFVHDHFLKLQTLGVAVILLGGIKAPEIHGAILTLLASGNVDNQPKMQLVSPAPAPNINVTGESTTENFVKAPETKEENPGLDLKLGINFRDGNNGSFSPQEKQKIQKGVNDAFKYWGNRGVQAVNLYRSKEINVQPYANNESVVYADGQAWIRLATKDERTAAHETEHLFCLRVEGMPGFFEGVARMTETELYGNPLGTKVTAFTRIGSKFTDYGNLTAMNENYKRAGAAAQLIERENPGFWATMHNEYYKWMLSQPGQICGKFAPPSMIQQWVEKFKKDLWVQIKTRFPIMFSK